jgi:hypothetical protein
MFDLSGIRGAARSSIARSYSPNASRAGLIETDTDKPEIFADLV